MPEFEPTLSSLGGDYETTKKQQEEKQKFLDSLVKDGFDLNNKEDVTGLGRMMVGEINELFFQKYNISVPEGDLPLVTVKEGTNPAHVVYHIEDKESNKSKINFIILSGIGDVLNGNYLSEELTHFYRFYLEPDQPNEIITDEFFGFLGRRLWNKMLPEMQDTDFSVLVDNKGGINDIASKKETLKYSKYTREVVKYWKDNGYEVEGLEKGLKEKRKSALIHQRGYEYASKVDLEQIHDWKKFFSMPNAEVRRRFFTPNPDYSGL